MKFASLFFVSLASLLFCLVSRAPAGSPKYFEPMHRISGIGLARDDISDEVLQVRTDLMIQSQTFSIMREPLAVAGARRITSPKLQALFQTAAQRSGLPASLIQAGAFVSSWGVATARTPPRQKG